MVNFTSEIKSKVQNRDRSSTGMSIQSEDSFFTSATNYYTYSLSILSETTAILDSSNLTTISALLIKATSGSYDIAFREEESVPSVPIYTGIYRKSTYLYLDKAVLPGTIELKAGNEDITVSVILVGD